MALDSISSDLDSLNESLQAGLGSTQIVCWFLLLKIAGSFLNPVYHVRVIIEFISLQANVVVLRIPLLSPHLCV